MTTNPGVMDRHLDQVNSGFPSEVNGQEANRGLHWGYPNLIRRYVMPYPQLFSRSMIRQTRKACLLGITLVMFTITIAGCPGPGNGGGTGGDGSGGTGDGTGGGGGGGDGGGGGSAGTNSVVVLGYNELGMHCMNQDFSELMILPPYNNFRAQVIDRSGEDPRIVTSGVTVRYSIPGNTHSADKTNFWTYAQALLGVALEPNVGLTGNGLTGTMALTGENDWVATGIPITPIDDTGHENPYQLGTVSVLSGGTKIGETQAVVPVSWEINCDLCHNTPGISAATDILRAHDRLHGTQLEQSKPVMCASCHADVALGQSGQPGVSNLSRAMHGAHASRMGAVQLATPCYACHPGIRTQCLRDVHYSHGMTCTGCHDSMTAVAAANRQPWVDEPRCGTCHQRAGFSFEQPNTLFRHSLGHSNVHCAACHGSPHAITPTVNAEDNVQALTLQGHAGVINTCTVCHNQQPDDAFFHHAGGGD
jgi:hypothetical protein